MKHQKKNVAENRDVLGRSWILAPGGYQTLDRSKGTLWDLEMELQGLSALFRSIGPGVVIEETDLYGIGVSLQRVSRRLGRLKERLGETVAEKNES